MLEELVKLFQEAGLDEAKSTGERIAAMGRFGAAPTGEPVKTPPPSFSQPDTWINIPYYHEAALLLAQRAARIESRFGISALQAYFSILRAAVDKNTSPADVARAFVQRLDQEAA